MKIFMSMRAVLTALLLAVGLSLASPMASAGDPQIDAAKVAGLVGERADGYLGLVDGSSDAAVRRKVNEVNAKRRALFERLSRDTGTTVEQVGFVTGEKQIANTPSGQYYMNANGQWVRK